MTESITFSQGTTVTSDWLNAVDAHVFDYSTNVKDYGAAGDGVTDDTASIQAAIDAVYLRGGGELYIPVGRYLISATLDVPQRVVLVGEVAAFASIYVSGSAAPRGSVIFMAAGSNVSCVRFRCRLTLDAGALIETALGYSNNDARHLGGIVGVTVWGNRSEDQSPTAVDLNATGHGIRIEGCRGVFLRDTSAMFCAQAGVSVVSYDYGTGVISSNNLDISNSKAISNAGIGFDLALGDSFISQITSGANALDGVQLVGSVAWTGGLLWNNKRHGLAALSMATTGSSAITGVHSYDNDQNGFRIGTGRAPALIGCVARGNGRDTGASATERCNYLVSSGADGWSLASCYAYARDQDGVMVSQYGFRIVNTTYPGTIDGCQSEGAAVSNFSISDFSRVISHGGTTANAVGHPALRFTSLSQTPTTPADATTSSLYYKDNKLIAQYNDAGTTRYKYLDLSGTGVTWVHTTVAP